MTQPENSPLVSIIIPAYNTAQYIHRAIGSSLRQTHRNVEILIVDDGSTDDTLRVAEYFAGTDSRIRVFTQENAGVSVARNHGIDEARGEYIMFLDSDDWLEDNAIEILLDAQREHPCYVICANFYDAVEIDGGSLVRQMNLGTMDSSHAMSLNDVAETYCSLQKPPLFNYTHAKLFRSPCNARFPEGIINCEDAVFFMRYFMQSSRKAYYINTPILNFFKRKGSLTRITYKPEIVDSKIEAYKIITGLMENEECRNLMLMSFNLQLYLRLRQALVNRIPRAEIKRIRSAIKPSVWLTIKCRRYPVRTRLKYFMAVFAPVALWRAFMSMLRFIRNLRDKKQTKQPYDIVPGWQDFPKAPGI